MYILNSLDTNKMISWMLVLVIAMPLPFISL